MVTDEETVEGVNDGVEGCTQDGIEEEDKMGGETEEDCMGTDKETVEVTNDGEVRRKDGIEENDKRDGDTEKDGVGVPIVVARSVEGREDCSAV